MSYSREITHYKPRMNKDSTPTWSLDASEMSEKESLLILSPIVLEVGQVETLKCVMFPCFYYVSRSSL